ncbi:MAG: DUF3047 domain-containing protein [Desulfobacterales bacterium]|nr:MAG: DUF3047 domain-containing protein [Desulfobacterales bacterium]
MTRLTLLAIAAMFVITWGTNSLFSTGPYAQSQPADAFQKVNFFIDFSDYDEDSVETWLSAKGFKFERDAQNRKKLDLDVSEDALVLEAKTRVRGFLFNEGVDLEEYSAVRLEWGIIQYPEGASYERGVNNEALMVFIFFGYDKISSGHFAIPNSPYFIGLFLGQEEQVDKAYQGRYFRKGGRFVCLGNPQPGETVVSTFDLISAFQSYFEKDEVPIISGIALAVDTSSAGNGGRAAAFIKSIEFLE